MDTSKILSELRAQRERISQAIAALETLNGTAVSAPTARKTPSKAVPANRTVAKKRVISPEGRKRMAEAQRKRWADRKKASKTA